MLQRDSYSAKKSSKILIKAKVFIFASAIKEPKKKKWKEELMLYYPTYISLIEAQKVLLLFCQD